jgi:3-oxoadipate enol-lactonase
VPELVRPDGCRLYHELHGPAPSGRSPLILLEGLGGDIPGWRRNVPRLAARRPVVAYDFRGNGRSDKPDRPMSMGTFVEDTVALLDHLGIERAHLYGQSFGGIVAQEMALEHPGRVRSLVLACTHPGPAHAVRAGSESNVPKDRPYLALYSPRFAAEHPEHVREDLATGRRNPQPPHAARRQREAMLSWSSWDRLGRIVSPTLVLHGTEDRVIPVANAHLLASRIPGARLVLLEGAGHLYHSEQAEAADAAVLAFLDEVEAAGR